MLIKPFLGLINLDIVRFWTHEGSSRHRYLADMEMVPDTCYGLEVAHELGTVTSI